MIGAVLVAVGVLVVLFVSCLGTTWVVVWAINSEVTWSRLPRFVWIALRTRVEIGLLDQEHYALLDAHAIHAADGPAADADTAESAGCSERDAPAED